MSLQTLQERIRDAAGRGAALRLRGGGTKDFYGNALRGEVLDTRGFAGIVSYEPTELVVTARCGTLLSELDTTLAELTVKRAILSHALERFPAAGDSVWTATAAGLKMRSSYLGKPEMRQAA